MQLPQGFITTYDHQSVSQSSQAALRVPRVQKGTENADSVVVSDAIM